MALSCPCIELAKLFLIAVDFLKTGIPAEIPNLRVKEYPDFMDKPDKTVYKSERIIGELFWEVKDITPQAALPTSFTEREAQNWYDPDMEYYKSEYDFKLGNLMEYYGIKTEAEILSGAIMKTSKTFDRRKDAEAIGLAVRALRNEVRSWFKKESETRDAYAMASAWYHVTYHVDYWGRFISFPWCVYDKLVQIKKDQVSSLSRQFKRVTNLG